MKKYVLLVTPPIVTLFFKKIAHSIRRSKTDRSSIDNYNDDSLTQMIVEKNRIFRENLSRNKTIDLGALRTILGVCLAGAGSSGEPINVLDLGGGGGYHYFIARLVLPENIKLRWHVVETDSMVSSAEKLSGAELKFFPSIREAASGMGKIDLIFASSSLQYFSDQRGLIDELIRTGSENIFITRTPFSPETPVRGEKQQSLFSSNGPGPLPEGYADKVIEYPIYIMNLDEFLELFSRHYDLRFQIKEESPGFRINGKTFDNYGFYFNRRSLSI
jgi:putative methyltransferase (TIGR04325 family)